MSDYFKCVWNVTVTQKDLYISTKRSGCYAPILLAPAEGWGPCRPCWGPSAPSRVAISNLWTLNFEKLEICATLIIILHYLGAKFDYCYFIFFLRYGFKILHIKSQVIFTKTEGVTVIFPNFDLILNWENQCHALIFAQNDL